MRSVILHVQARKTWCSVLLVVDVWETGKMVMILGENMLNGFLSKLTDCPINISICTKRLICFDIPFFLGNYAGKQTKNPLHFCLQGCYFQTINFSGSLF